MKKTAEPERRQEITDFYLAFYKAYSSREWDKMSAYLDEGLTAIGTGPDEDCYEKKEVLERMKREFEQAPDPVKYDIREFEVYDISQDVALIMARKDLVLNSRGKEVHFRDHRVSVVVAKNGGKWKIVHGHFSQPDLSGADSQQDELINKSQELEQQVEERTREISLRKDELEKMNDIKNKLFYAIAHDLKGPFNNIIGFSQLLFESIEDYSQEEIRSSIAQIYRLGRRTYDMLENLLYWSKAETASFDYHPTYIKLVPFIQDVRRYLSIEAGEKEVNIEYDIPDTLVIYADRNLLTVLMRNLIHNAIKFSNKEGKVVISAASGDSEITVKVEDEGTGIAPEMQDQLFDGLYNESSRGTSMEKGTGLGLVLSKACVERHDGSIWLESEVGRGSSFFFSLPKVMPKSLDDLFSDEDY